MSSSGTSITCEVGLQLIVPDRAPVPLVARLDYSVDDPYAIRAAFHVATSWFLPGRRATTSTSTLKSLSTSARPAGGVPRSGRLDLSRAQ